MLGRDDNKCNICSRLFNPSEIERALDHVVGHNDHIADSADAASTATDQYTVPPQCLGDDSQLLKSPSPSSQTTQQPAQLRVNNPNKSVSDVFSDDD